MATHVALLRAVNVGGFKVAMADLRETAEALGWSDVATHLNSGNLLFTSSEKAAKDYKVSDEEKAAVFGDRGKHGA